mmetsp:Transcript_87320/g.244437  ORF Transcript_87320/g.244437 Transcript_87320/m.244437 type:complete len:315 (+) Transcript_87320:628-1572(+)
MTCTSPAAAALRKSFVWRSMRASLSVDIFCSMCFCTKASQNSCNCCAMSTCRMVRNCNKSVPHIDKVCQTDRACSYHCDNDAKDAAPEGLSSTPAAPSACGESRPKLLSISRCRSFRDALARPIHWKTRSRNCKDFKAYKFVGRDTCKPYCTSSLKALGMTKIDSLSRKTKSCSLKDCGRSFCCNSCTDSSNDFFTVATHSYCCCWFTMLKHCSTNPMAGEIRASLRWYKAKRQTWKRSPTCLPSSPRLLTMTRSEHAIVINATCLSKTSSLASTDRRPSVSRMTMSSRFVSRSEMYRPLVQRPVWVAKEQPNK